jgi:hypothetical protein
MTIKITPNVRLREASGMPKGLAWTKAVRAGVYHCHSCGRWAMRPVASHACCDDPTCASHAEMKAGYARLKART